jgi:recombinational DNA repair protein RecR
MKELQTVTALIDSFSKLPGIGVKAPNGWLTRF